MAEFTAGILFLTRDLLAVEGQLTHLSGFKYRLRPLNETWSAFFVRDEWLREPETVLALRRVSWAAPLLYFRYAEGQGWGFQIYDGGLRPAALHIDYDLVRTGRHEAIEQQFADCDVDAFEVFDLPESDLDGLARILTPEFIAQSKHLWEQVCHFKMYLNMVELYYIAYSALADETPAD